MNKARSCALTAGLSVALAAHAFAGDYRAPRLPDGTPDLQGVWTNATATPFERSPELGDRRAFTEQEAAAISKAAIAAVEADAAPSDPNKKIEAISSLPPVGNYNLFWTDRGMIGREHQRRVSHLDDHRAVERAHSARSPRPPSSAWPRARARNPNDGPEGRALGERCLLSFGSASGPPMLPIMYNSYYQIVQSPGYVMILVEMVHDARIIRIRTAHAGRHPEMDGRFGRSLGRRHAGGRDAQLPSRAELPRLVRERGRDRALHARRQRQDRLSLHRRRSRDVHRAVHGRAAVRHRDANIYEYACHEGNYALPGILSGAREDEKAAIAFAA